MEQQLVLQQSGAVTAYTLNNLESIQRLSTDLKKFITGNNLTTPIQGKTYVNVEGWQAAGGLLGLFPVVTQTINQSTGSEYKYEAHVELRRMADGSVVGTGIAICTNKESKKRTFDEYAVCSMAQTRAIGKAYRNLLAWVMKMSGFEATPAEEMDFASQAERDEELRLSIAKLQHAGSVEELKELKAMLPPFVLNQPDFIKAAKQRYQEINQNQTA